MPGLFSRVKTWIARENLKRADLNAEFDNVITNFVPAQMDDYSTNVTQMQQQTDPGAQGSESLPTSLAGELERIRFVIKRLTGETYWYDSPDSSIASLKSTLDAATLLPRNRIVSGRKDSNNQPMFLVPNGGLSVKLDGTPTNFSSFIKDVQVDVTTDLTLSGLSGPASFTLAVNGAQTNIQGEDFSTITVSTATGSAPAVDSYQSWKIVNGASTEYFYARYDSATQLSNARRGFFFNASDSPISNIALGNSNTITLMRTGYIFLSNVSGVKALEVTYNKPIVSKDTPTGSSVGDFWFDTANDLWKKSDGSNFADANALFVGYAVIDGTSVVATRSSDFNNVFTDLNTFAQWEVKSNTVIRNEEPGARISVYGEAFEFINQEVDFDITADLDSGLSETSNTDYYAYITDLGDTILSTVVPFDRSYDLRGFYHRHKPWRCVAVVRNDASSNFITVQPVNKTDPYTAKVSNSSTGSTLSTTFISTGISTLFFSRGRPIVVCLVGIPGAGEAFIGTERGVSAVPTLSSFRIVRDSTEIGRFQLRLDAATSSGILRLYLPASFICYDPTPPTGYVAYTLEFLSGFSDNQASFQNTTLVAFHVS